MPPLIPGTEAEVGEDVLLCHDRASGLSAVIAIDDTTFGPGLGGVRDMAYPSYTEAVQEACRLARVMTLKNVVAELPYGGAKSVIMRDESARSPARRRAQILAFARHLAPLGDRYIPGVDMGTSVADMALMATVAPHVSCQHDDPSPATALGVLHAIRAAVRHVMHHDLVGIRVTVQGTGHVGAALAGLLVESGATVVVADVDGDRAARVAKRVGGAVVTPDDALHTPCDVLAPCASARVLDKSAIDALQCSMIIGAANDVLSQRSGDDLLSQRGIVYVPDFVSNAGGVIHIHAGRAAWDDHTLDTALTAIGTRTHHLLEESDATHCSPLSVAERWASDRLSRPITIPD